MKDNLKYILAGIGIITLFVLAWFFKSIIVYLLIAAVLSLIVRPLVDFLERLKIGRMKIPRGIAALVGLLLIWGFFAAFFIIFVPLIISQAQEFSRLNVQTVLEGFQAPFERISRWLQEMHISSEASTDFQEFLARQVVALLNLDAVTNIVGNLAGIIGELFIAFFSISFFTYFFIKDKHLFVNGLMLLAPVKYEENARHFIASSKRLLTRYFIGILLEVTFLIILISIGLVIVGLHFQLAVVIALILGLLNVIPYLGPAIGWVIGLIMAATHYIQLDPTGASLLHLLWMVVLVFAIVKIIDDTLFQPFIYGTSVMAHPVEIFIVILAGAMIAGIPGMILAVPGYTVLRVFAKEFFNQFKLVKKLTEKIE